MSDAPNNDASLHPLRSCQMKGLRASSSEPRHDGLPDAFVGGELPPHSLSGLGRLANLRDVLLVPAQQGLGSPMPLSEVRAFVASITVRLLDS